jgi:putative DNA primase/helicase
LNLTPEPIRWLWEGYLARGKLHIIAGAPGTGKTTLALAFAATITAGGRWPDGTRAEPGNILIWSGEDDVRDTLLPRLIAMGADRARVYFVGDVQAEGQSRPFDPSRDMTALELKAKEIGDVRLLIVDPVVNAVSGDSHKNTETRRSLQPVVDLASRLDAVALGVSHFSKGTAGRDPVERVTGSIAFGALPRIIFAAAKTTDEDAPAKRVFVRSKSNIGPDGGGFGYDLEQIELSGHPGLFASRVLWVQALEGTAKELLATMETVEEERTERDEAAKWLKDELEKGPVTAKQLQASAREAGLAWRTVQRSKNALGITSHREGFGKDAVYIWTLPADTMRATKPHARHLSESGIHGTHGTHDGISSAEGESLRAERPSRQTPDTSESPVYKSPNYTPEAPAAGPADTDPEGERL